MSLSDPNGAQFNFIKYEENENGERVRVYDPKAEYYFKYTLEKLEKAGIEEAKKLRAVYESSVVIDFVLEEEGLVNEFAANDAENEDRPTLHWAPLSAFAYGVEINDWLTIPQFTSPAVGLVHEGDHMYRYITDSPELYKRDGKPDKNNPYGSETERKATQAEFNAGAQLNQLLFMRPDHSHYIMQYSVANPMSNVPSP
jgi:hypothetical protein